MVRIAIVDDKHNIRQTLKEKLGRFDGYEVLFVAENGKDFLQSMREARKTVLPDVVLMDIDMPLMDGIKAVSEAKIRYPQTRFLMLTIFDEDEKIFNAIKVGANGYLLKDEPLGKIKEAIDNLMNNEGAPMSPGIARKVLNLLSHAPQNLSVVEKTPNTEEYNLTTREREILTLLVDGLEYKEIAGKLGISPNTVRNNITKIYGKLHVTSRMEAAKVMRK